MYGLGFPQKWASDAAKNDHTDATLGHAFLMKFGLGYKF
jgi:hypothetical protein